MNQKLFQTLFVSLCVLTLLVNNYIMFNLWIDSKDDVKSLLTGFIACIGINMVAFFLLLIIINYGNVNSELFFGIAYLGAAISVVTILTFMYMAHKAHRSMFVALLIPLLVLLSLRGSQVLLKIQV